MSDLKYLFAYSIPLMTLVSISYNGILTFATPLYAFIFIPLLEIILKDYDREYSESQKEKRLNNILFDILLYLNIPFVFGLLAYGFWVLETKSLLPFEMVGIVLSLGILLATNAINVAHELGHRKTQRERTLSKLLLLPCLYMHFYLEHNFGHHKNVATPEDPATSKKNQSVYHFWITSVLKQYKNAWQIQLSILAKGNHTYFSLKNDMLWYSIFQLCYLDLCFLFFGISGLLFALAVGVLSFVFLETINYVEHYGLVRKKLPSGRYERVQTHHSWNSNHIIGRIVLYELTRHSDHHFKASKKYQILENKKESPQLPFGYPTSILLSLVPPLWFWIMNSRIPE
ncbi:alkane 1-monooxygenase [Flavobacteriaceae bacterium]|jgi:alkane 1-monooxygenase|nr:alkane 1-monooxygenase [Flavobacteriaceae bacterium]MDB4270035.1 alkane 1-monooxygenase [Flavobacteriaceae bacterium]